MAKVASHTPNWLSRPSPGFQLFQPTAQTKAPASWSLGQGKKTGHAGPCRTIAHRGTEIFVVVGNEIRWSDLVLLRDAAGEQHHGRNRDGGRDAEFRILKTPVAGQIRQLRVSPRGDFLAILTSHTVHVAVLPDSSHLGVPDAGPLRIKTFQLGPTAHVLEQAPVVSALWHPLGHLGACLVTVTSDACVRVWELNRESRHSFDEPALALDLKKLANATSSDEDFRASKYGTSKGFSPDSVEMEVAAACFGGAATAEEHGWSPMTLWVAMTEGDVYALCPLLPSKWEPTATTIPSLSTAVVSKSAVIGHDASATDEERRITEQQHRWLADVDSQDPLTASHPQTLQTFEVYSRPSSPPAIPRLQGPFQLSPEPEFGEITDIFAIAPRIDDEALMQEEDDDEGLYEREGLSVGVICLATSTGKVHICLDLVGVEAQWLPSRRSGFKRRFETEMEEASTELILVETIDTAASNATAAWPTFSRDVTSRYSFFLSLPDGLYSISLNPWISSLEDELISPAGSGAGFRLDVLLESEHTLVSQILSRNAGKQEDSVMSTPACISILDSDLGHFILTSTSSQPQAVTLDVPLQNSIYTSFAPDEPLALPTPDVRQPYLPSDVFFAPSSLPAFLDSVTQSAHSRLTRTDLKSQVRFSPATLQLLTDAHRVLSTETSRLGVAAADLFRRCERMRAELAEQVRKVDDIANKIEAVTGDDDDDEGEPDVNGARLVGKQRIDQRVDAARARSADLGKRVEALRRKMAGLGGKELSAREEAWSVEVAAVQDSLGGTDSVDGDNGSNGDGEDSEKQKLAQGGDAEATFSARLQSIEELQRQLLAQAKDATSRQRQGSAADNVEDEEADAENGGLSASLSSVPPEFRKQKISQVMMLLERETALVDAVTERLGRLGGIGIGTGTGTGTGTGIGGGIQRSTSSLL
ncbi:hypothetical protein MBLNU459_g4966t1 [Dothideomycetes sp. NU459]